MVRYHLVVRGLTGNNPAVTSTAPIAIDHLDVLIVGAGVSGIGAAYHLQATHPAKRYAILEARDDLGGTWDLFRYPGIRSDSDLHTFGYAFKPWTGDKAIADGHAIREYIRETATENGIDGHIRFGHRVRRAEWSTANARWTVEVERDGETVLISSRWLFCASGYYRYDEGYTPELPGLDRFAGPVIHPQQWPEDLDYAGKRVVVIGSGATAVTLVPAMAPEAEHVTMLQRSPSYVLPVPAEDPVANRLRALLGEKRAYPIIRRKNILRQRAVFVLSKRFPKAVRRLIRAVNAKQLEGSGCDVDVHFKPAYDPWDQRLCAVPNGDLFRALRSGQASIATDQIDTFTETGIRLQSGQELAADIVVTATGLNVLGFGGIEFTVDGDDVSLPDTLTYKAMMLSGLPNYVYAIGYTNSSWTLKVDLVCEYFCRLIGHLDLHGYDACVPVAPDNGMERRPLLDFKAGYVLRALDALPKQGTQAPWTVSMSYTQDARALRNDSLEDDAIRFFSAESTEPAAAVSDPAERELALR
jgi:monooxygenase